MRIDLTLPDNMSAVSYAGCCSRHTLEGEFPTRRGLIIMKSLKPCQEIPDRHGVHGWVFWETGIELSPRASQCVHACLERRSVVFGIVVGMSLFFRDCTSYAVEAKIAGCCGARPAEVGWRPETSLERTHARNRLAIEALKAVDVLRWMQLYGIRCWAFLTIHRGRCHSQRFLMSCVSS